MDAASLLRLVSETTRHGLLSALRRGERSVNQLVTELADEQSNVSHHLKVLRDAGLVTAVRRGRSQLYRLSDAEIGRVLDQVEALASRLDRLGYVAVLGLPADPQFHGYG